MRKVDRAPENAQRVADAASFLARHGKSSEVWIVTPPGGYAARALLRGLTHAKGATLGLRAYSTRQLALRLAQPSLVTSGSAPVVGLGRRALCSRALRAQQAAQALGRFGAIAETPGFPGALVDTLDELRRSDITAAALSDQAPELAGLLTRYEQELQDQSLADDALLYALASKALERVHPLPPLVWLDASVVDRAAGVFACALIRACSPVLVTCSPGDAAFEEHVLGPLGEELIAVTDAERAQGKTGDSGCKPGKGNALRRLQQQLFRAPTLTGAADESVVILSAPGEARECVELARRLLWEAERGVPFDHMAVLTRRASHYGPHLREAFRRAGIPIFTTLDAQRPDPHGRALLSLLALREEGFAARRLSEYLSLNVAPRAPRPRDEDAFYPADADLYPDLARPAAAAGDAPQDDAPGVRSRSFERLLAQAAVRGGRDAFEARLRGLLADREERLNTQQSSGQDHAGLHQEAEDALALVEFAVPLLDALQALPETATVERWLPALQGLCMSYLRSPERVLRVLAEFSTLHGHRPLPLRQLIATLQEPLTTLREPSLHDIQGRVFVGSAEEARGMHFAVVCVPGLAEKVFPERVREDPLLLDDARRMLGNALPTHKQRTARERCLLGLAVGAARSKLILSYPRLDLDRGRPRVPSFYALEALRAAEGELLSYDALMQRAERESQARIGWPAPAEPSDAIDDAEHDLSALARPLREADARHVGAARYLLHVNPHLARALRARARRWTVRRFGPADGLVELSAENLARLASLSPARHPYAVTALQHFAACPYRFYLHAIQQLRERPASEPVDEMGHAHRGTLIHRAMFETVRRLREGALLPLGRASLTDAHRLLDDVFTRVSEEERARVCPSIDRVWADGVARARADLHAWLERMPGRLPPLDVEYGFGVGRSRELSPNSREEPITVLGRLQLKGAIDLIEGDEQTLCATDYKTGPVTTPEGVRIAGGQVLQPALYGLVAKAERRPRGAVEGRLYYATLRGDFEERAVPINAQTERAVGVLADALDEAIEDGFFPAAPAEGACERCEYVAVCGPYEEQRTRHKRSEHLVPLTRLRREP